MMIWLASCSIEPVSTYSRPKAAASEAIITKNRFGVSTHSRPKAAAKLLQNQSSLSGFQHTAARRRLPNAYKNAINVNWFQHTAARRRLHVMMSVYVINGKVSTHSRPKAAATQSMSLR